MRKELKDPGFLKEAIESTEGSEENGYLGDVQHVGAILRLAASEVLDLLPEAVENDRIETMIHSIGKKRMRAFFGNQGHRPVRGFNEPGGVDMFVAEWTGTEANTPTERLIGGFASLISELLDVEGFAGKENSLKEQWQWQVDAILDRYAMIFMGIAPPTQELLS